MDITPRKRERIITLSEHTPMTQRDIAKECCVSLGAVKRIIKKKKETGSVEVQRNRKCERKRNTAPRDEAFLLRDSKLHPRKTSYDLQQDLEKAGVKIHDSTLRRRLLEEGRRAVRPHKKQLLTAPMMKND